MQFKSLVVRYFCNLGNALLICIIFLTTGRRSNTSCGCMKDNLPCTAMCQCQGCTNTQEQPEDEIDDGSDEEDDDHEYE